MSIHVLSWVMKNSPTRLADRLVLIVLADQSRSDDGTSCYPSVRLIKDEANLSERQVQMSLRALEQSGQIVTERGGGREHTNAYRVVIDHTESAQLKAKRVQDVQGAESAPPSKGRRVRPERVQNSAVKGATVAPEPSTNRKYKPTAANESPPEVKTSANGHTAPAEPTTSENGREPLTPAGEINLRAQALARMWTELVPLSKFPATLGICKRAIQAGKTDPEIEAALRRMASEGRTLTIDSLRVELEGLPPSRYAEPTQPVRRNPW